VVVLKYFGGLTNKEVAEAMDIGERSVDRHWMCAKNGCSGKFARTLMFPVTGTFFMAEKTFRKAC